MDNTTCDAWGIDYHLPLIMRSAFSADYFLDSTTVPKIEMFQKTEKGKKPFKLKYQLDGKQTTEREGESENDRE